MNIPVYVEQDIKQKLNINNFNFPFIINCLCKLETIEQIVSTSHK